MSINHRNISGLPVNLTYKKRLKRHSSVTAKVTEGAKVMNTMKLKALIAAALLAALCFGLAGCSEKINLNISDSPAEQEGVTVTLNKASAVRKSKPDRYEYVFSGKITNDSDEGIMKVIYTFSLRDKNGDEFRSFAEVYDGEDKAIPSHTSIDFSFDDFKYGAQDIPSSVSIGIASVQTETELPPAVIPQAGDYLYQVLGDEHLANIKSVPPIQLAFHIDQGGYGRTATFEEGEELDRAVELLCDIKIGEETDEMVTDNYNWILLTWPDGSETSISLNLKSLEFPIHNTPHIYGLENLGSFWNYASEYLVED